MFSAPSFEEIRDALAEINPDALFADGFEDALVGWVNRFGMEPVALYDTSACIRILMERDGLSRDEAEEHFAFNVIGAWVGDGTPAFAMIG